MWDPNAQRIHGSSCGASCSSADFCNGVVDPPSLPASTPEVDTCAGVSCEDDNCLGSCCKKGPRGSCDGLRMLRH
jgi:hypothetical protein